MSKWQVQSFTSLTSGYMSKWQVQSFTCLKIITCLVMLHPSWALVVKNFLVVCSAYSIFNEGFRELPGTLNAERLDRDIRAGQF
jgi:hypothetical protein